MIVTFPPERVMAALEPIKERPATTIFDLAPPDQEPDRAAQGAIGGFFASINFGGVRRMRASRRPAHQLVVIPSTAAPLKTPPDKSETIARP